MKAAVAHAKSDRGLVIGPGHVSLHVQSRVLLILFLSERDCFNFFSHHVHQLAEKRLMVLQVLVADGREAAAQAKKQISVMLCVHVSTLVS